MNFSAIHHGRVHGVTPRPPPSGERWRAQRFRELRNSPAAHAPLTGGGREERRLFHRSFDKVMSVALVHNDYKNKEMSGKMHLSLRGIIIPVVLCAMRHDQKPLGVNSPWMCVCVCVCDSRFSLCAVILWGKGKRPRAFSCTTPPPPHTHTHTHTNLKKKKKKKCPSREL